MRHASREATCAPTKPERIMDRHFPDILVPHHLFGFGRHLLQRILCKGSNRVRKVKVESKGELQARKSSTESCAVKSAFDNFENAGPSSIRQNPQREDGYVHRRLHHKQVAIMNSHLGSILRRGVRLGRRKGDVWVCGSCQRRNNSNGMFGFSF